MQATEQLVSDCGERTQLMGQLNSYTSIPDMENAGERCLTTINHATDGKGARFGCSQMHLDCTTHTPKDGRFMQPLRGRYKPPEYT
jgi:hypothetical protein